MNYQKIENNKFEYPFRIFISGSSQSGKTHFAQELLKNDIFDQRVKHIKYYHPDFLDQRPVNWHDTLHIPISYQSGLPSLDEVCDISADTCIVLDDLYEEAINSKATDYLFRVLSGKKNLSVMIMSQRYFAQGKYAMNIRNNCNFTVLMRNVDSRVNIKIARLLDVEKPATFAMNDIYKHNYYPHLFIDSSPRGQVTSFRCYISIFGRVKVSFDQKGMKGYILSEKDFLNYFHPIDNNTAARNGDNEKVSLSTTKETTKETDIAKKLDSRIRERKKKRLARSLRKY